MTAQNDTTDATRTTDEPFADPAACEPSLTSTQYQHEHMDGRGSARNRARLPAIWFGVVVVVIGVMVVVVSHSGEFLEHSHRIPSLFATHDFAPQIRLQSKSTITSASHGRSQTDSKLRTCAGCSGRIMEMAAKMSHDPRMNVCKIRVPCKRRT